jgi:hypothetical protein
MTAVVVYAPDPGGVRARDRCTEYAARVGLDIIAVTGQVSAALGLIASGRADAVLVATAAHAERMHPPVKVVQRRTPGGPRPRWSDTPSTLAERAGWGG